MLRNIGGLSRFPLRRFFGTPRSVGEFKEQFGARLRQPPHNTTEFLDVVRHLTFADTLKSLSPQDLIRETKLFLPFIQAGIRHLDWKLLPEDWKSLCYVFALLVRVREAGGKWSVSKQLENYYEQNFKRNLTPFLEFLDALTLQLPFGDSRVSGQFVPLYYSAKFILEVESKTLSDIQRVKLVSFLIFFAVSLEEQPFIDREDVRLSQVNSADYRFRDATRGRTAASGSGPDPSLFLRSSKRIAGPADANHGQGGQIPAHRRHNFRLRTCLLTRSLGTS